MSDNEELRRRLEERDKDIKFLHQRRGELVIERDNALTELRQVTERRDKLATQVGELTGRLAAAEQREVKLARRCEGFEAQYEALSKMRDEMWLPERAALTAENQRMKEALISTRDRAIAGMEGCILEQFKIIVDECDIALTKEEPS